VPERSVGKLIDDGAAGAIGTTVEPIGAHDPTGYPYPLMAQSLRVLTVSARSFLLQ